MELLGVIATGMRQLQEVQIKQMDKRDGPEVVKPGISSLPQLDVPGKDTSPVDIHDWLEEVGSIMGDLSDTSHEWWTGVREVADEHYKKWVKSEMVTKKVSGSSLSLVFKLLTTYRPGGEQEKTLLLEQLTTPEGASTPELAVINRCTRSYLEVINGRTRSYLEVINRCTRSYLEVINGRTRSYLEGKTQPTPMELLGVIATGMRQLQEVQIKQMDKRDGPEVVKPGISSLPQLDAPGKDTSPVDIQDWLEEVGSIMGDLSDTSHEWWTGVREVADEHYKKWVTATPMEKLTLALPRNPKLEHGKYGRVNARAAGMILGALAAEVKSEMVTKKVTGSSLSLVFKLLTTYRPGGEQEKTLLLEQLTTPEGASTPELAVQALRKWGRWFSRAKDLTVAVPDPVLMVKGLALIVAPVLVKNQDVWLRTTMMRNRLQLDSNPAEETTLDFHEHLQAEMELLSTTSSTAPRTAPRIKSVVTPQDSAASSGAAQGPKTKPEKKDKVCKWFAKSDDGCRRGADCQFQHDWGNTAKTGRCLLCSAMGHQKKDCPTKKQGGANQQPSSSNPSKGKGKGDKGSGVPTTTPSTSTTPATRSMAANASAKENPQPGPEPSPAGNVEVDDGNYGPYNEHYDLRSKARGALLDSGATHVLRPAKDDKEHRTSKEVPVVLAGDERRLLRQNPAGSIILDPSAGEDAQTILPLGKLVESLGCTLKWTGEV
eukprot:s1633_g17.t1